MLNYVKLICVDLERAIHVKSNTDLSTVALSAMVFSTNDKRSQIHKLFCIRK